MLDVSPWKQAQSHAQSHDQWPLVGVPLVVSYLLNGIGDQLTLKNSFICESAINVVLSLLTLVFIYNKEMNSLVL